MALSLHRGAILHFPTATHNPADDHVYHADGVLLIDDGKILALSSAEQFFAADENQHWLNSPNYIKHQGLILPGMIDSHVHFPQMEIIASYGNQLLDWLNQYTFPAESQFGDQAYANQQAEFFIQQLFKHGTTSACVYATIHPESVNAFFEQAQAHHACMIAGKVMMDRHCPDNLRDEAQQSYHQSKALIEQWHKTDRLLYAVTPRFAPTSTPLQLQLAGQLATEHPDTFIQTHISENKDEIAWVASLYPESKDYLDVYQQNNLVRERCLLGHGIHLTEREKQAIADTGASISFCPSSNLFLGSGLFPYFEAKERGIPVSIASDVGGGTSLSLFANQSDAYKILQLQNQSLNPFESLYLCTQGAAVAMGLEHDIGNLNQGTAADFIVLDTQGSDMLSQRLQKTTTLSEALFAYIVLGDDRAIEKTYVAGKQVYQSTLTADNRTAVS
ncbi:MULTISPECIES: guanine deaminase [unclassified Vibrio]|uniref:Guanine deaminase n=1 Tax=Vibrio sp. HB236076 TaxID=3232307 RepID=A0AB39HJU0_9VIBR|nr:guanine deaminase [Vibrio sp. HB161653]MDP5252841.1 guanine deaminase [Vibrio sp. HB161653]